jgi:flavin reductase (DIM6/NTAB) family NADH-FMN oxidoreductase RutF
MTSKIKKLFFKDQKITTFFITRLRPEVVEEQVFLKKDGQRIEITKTHSMICLDPFCISVWLTKDEAKSIDTQTATVQFTKGDKLNAVIEVSLIEPIYTEKGVLLLYKIESAKNYHLTFLHRLLLFRYFLRSKKNTYYSRKVISALYSYPRRIIIVSYRDKDYYNIFPMDIQGYLEEDDLYILGLRTTNLTLNKILEAKKVVICDTDTVGIDTVYDLGKHSSSAPTPIHELPFYTSESELFGFPIPGFTGSYKEIEIIANREMGYHMLMIGKVVNDKKIKETPSSLYHVGFLQFQNGNYESIEGLF